MARSWRWKRAAASGTRKGSSRRCVRLAHRAHARPALALDGEQLFVLSGPEDGRPFDHGLRRGRLCRSCHVRRMSSRTPGRSRLRWPVPRRPTCASHLDRAPVCLCSRQVKLVQHHNLGLVRQGAAVPCQLGVDGLVVGQRVLRCTVQQVDQQPGALHVAQELVAQAGPSAAPSMSPGRSATTKLCRPSSVTTPRFGCRVVKG